MPPVIVVYITKRSERLFGKKKICQGSKPCLTSGGESVQGPGSPEEDGSIRQGSFRSETTGKVRGIGKRFPVARKSRNIDYSPLGRESQGI